MFRTLFCSLLAPAFAAGLAAQGPPAPALAAEPGQPVAPAALPAALLGDDAALWRVPIHTHAADPQAGEYGWWAGGRGYKASFHDGFAFYVALGPSYPEHLPLRWTTEAVTVGGEPAFDLRSPAHAHTDWRYEYRFAGLTEAYDVRLEGVEQSFVLHQQPRGQGDLVIRGRIDTRLQCPPTAAAHQALCFADAAGTPIATYGEAFAFDAAGRRTAVATARHGEHVSLVVPADWLAGAAYPVTVDPLTAPASIAVFNNSVLNVDIAHDAESHELLFVASRRSTAWDLDTYAWLATNDFNGQVLIYTDLSTSYSTTEHSCCYVGGADRWAIAMERDPASGQEHVVLYTMPRANYTPNAGLTRGVDRSGGNLTYWDKSPSVGGSIHPTSGHQVALVWQRDMGGSPNALSVAMAAVVDVRVGGAISPSQQFSVSPITGDRERPSVNRCSVSGDWLVAYQYYDSLALNSDWDVRIAVVSQNGFLASEFALTNTSGIHEVSPKIEGCAGRYFVSCVLRNNDGYTSSLGGDRIGVQSFDWIGGITRSSPMQILETRTTQNLNMGGCNLPLAYDRHTGAHAVVGYQRYSTQSQDTEVVLVRVGSNGLPVEAASVASGRSPSLVYNPDYFTTDVGWCTTAAPTYVWGSHFHYPSSGIVNYANGCGPQYSVSNGDLPASRVGPYRGSSEFRMHLRNAGPFSTCIPVFSFGGGNIPLPGGCVLNLSNSPLITLPTQFADAAGAVDLPYPLPETWPQIDLYTQWAVLTVQSQFRSSNALRWLVR